MVDMFGDSSESITLRLNGGVNKDRTEFVMDTSDKQDLQLKNFLKDCCKKFGQKDKAPRAKLYSKSGIELLEDDMAFMKDKDVYYVAIEGEAFNNCANLDDYEVGEKLGEGGFGEVMLGTQKKTGQTVAIKFMDVSEYLKSASAVQTIYKEATNLRNLRHKNIVDLHVAFVEGHQLVMVMEYACGGEVLEYVTQKGKLNEFVSRKIINQVINALLYCHSRGIVHRDLKLENVLFRDKVDPDQEDGSDLFVKVIDFGIAGACTSTKGEKIDAGSIHYMPPECFEGVVVESTPSIDVWAIGLMFYSLLYGTLPFYAEDEHELIKRIKTAKLKFESKVPVTDEAKDIITRMLDRDPKTRLELTDFVEMEYYQYSESCFKEKMVEFEANYPDILLAKQEEQKNNASSGKVQLNLPNGKPQGRRVSPQRSPGQSGSRNVKGSKMQGSPNPNQRGPRR